MSNQKRRNAVKLKIDMGHDRVKTLYLKGKSNMLYTQKKTLSKDSVSHSVVEELLDPVFPTEILVFLSSISFLKDIFSRLER